MTSQSTGRTFPESSASVSGSEREYLEYVRLLPETDEEIEGRTWAIQPVPILEFARDYLGLDTLSDPQLGVLNGIFGDDPETTFFQVEQAVLKIGQGGGKNFASTVAVIYAIYLWCCLQDPHRYFNLKPYETFDILNFSQVNEQQARNVFFRELTSMMKNTKDPGTEQNWFTLNMGFQVKEFGRGDIKEKELSIPARDTNRGGIRVFCLDSKAETVEGYRIWIYIMDEPSRANTPVRYEKAKHQYDTAATNAETRFTMNHRLGVVFAYPEQETNDLLVELFDRYSREPAENKMEIADGILTAWYDTYIFNPKDQGAKKAQYEKALKEDPIDANRRWRAIVPPNVFGFFMPHMEKIADCANPNLPQPINYKTTITRRQAKVRGEARVVDFTALELTNVLSDRKERRWGGDFAVSKDRLVLVGGYNEKATKKIPDLTLTRRDPETGKEVKDIIHIDAYPIIDTILIWTPTKNHPIDYTNVEEIIISLFETHFPNSRSLHFDKWNTERIKQKLLDLGIYDCETLTFSNPEQLRYGRIFRHLVWNNACEYPDHPLLQKEMRQLLLLNNAKLDHPTGGSKDIWDAIVICVNQLVMHAVEGKALDIDTGEKTDMDAEAEGQAKLYDQVYKKFVDKHKRGPKDNQEFSDFMFREMGIRKSDSEIDYMREHWHSWLRDLQENILGLKEFRRAQGQEIEDQDLGFDVDELGADYDDYGKW